MSNSRAAIRYAKAILETSTTKNVADIVGNDMVLIEKTISTNAELKSFIENPTIKVSVKESALLAVFSSINATTKSLFKLLAVNKRFEILENIASEYTTQINEANGFETATVTTAFAMETNLQAQVSAKIATFSDKKISIQNVVDPSIIGGFIIKIGDKQYNASVANRLQILKRELNN